MRRSGAQDVELRERRLYEMLALFRAFQSCRPSWRRPWVCPKVVISTRSREQAQEAGRVHSWRTSREIWGCEPSSRCDGPRQKGLL